MQKDREASSHPWEPDQPAEPESGVFGLNVSEEEAGVVLLPVPFDATASYRRGSARGPAAILSASRHIDLFDPQAESPYRAGIMMLEAHPCIVAANEAAVPLAAPVHEAGGAGDSRPDLQARARDVDTLCDEVAGIVYETVERLLEAGKLAGTVGGEHSISFGAIRAHAERCPGLGILQIDAHADLRCRYEGFTWSHASIMHNVLERVAGVSRLVQVGVRDICEQEFERIQSSSGRIVACFDWELQRKKLSGVPWDRLVAPIVEALPSDVYVSFDVDGLDPSLCPNTGTPVPGGMTFPEVMKLLEAVASSGRRIVGFDLTEVAPGTNGDEWDGNVGARVLYKLIGFALKSGGRGA